MHDGLYRSQGTYRIGRPEMYLIVGRRAGYILSLFRTMADGWPADRETEEFSSGTQSLGSSN